MRTLLLTAYTPTLGGGTGLRTYGIVAALARSTDVDVAYRPFGAERPAAAFTRLGRVSVRPLERAATPRRLAAYARRRIAGVPAPIARGAAPELVAAARTASPGTRLVADGPTVAAALLGVARERPVVYCAHNLESAFRHRLPAGDRMSRGAMERFERTVLSVMAESWMVSQADIAGAAALCPAATLRLVPNVVDVRSIVPVGPARHAQRVLFVGDLRYAPNRLAVRFLRHEVMPRLWPIVPAARLAVAGRGPAPVEGDARTDVLGFVDDLPALYAASSVVAVPLTAGGGSPLKFIEALAFGLPVVATPTAAAGLDATPGQHYLEAEDPGAFAAALAHVLMHGAPGVGAAGRELAERRYSIEALAAELAR
jgi:glycosyltransferase involved in cell wall biosynthesis